MIAPACRNGDWLCRRRSFPQRYAFKKIFRLTIQRHSGDSCVKTVLYAGISQHSFARSDRGDHLPGIIGSVSSTGKARLLEGPRPSESFTALLLRAVLSMESTDWWFICRASESRSSVDAVLLYRRKVRLQETKKLTRNPRTSAGIDSGRGLSNAGEVFVHGPEAGEPGSPPWQVMPVDPAAEAPERASLEQVKRGTDRYRGRSQKQCGPGDCGG